MRTHTEYNPTPERLRELLFGRKIVFAEKFSSYSADNNYAEGRLTLDDGTVLLVAGNEGCGGCTSGHYWLSVLNTVDNAITNVIVEETFDGRYEEDGTYQIFVIAEDHNQHLVAQFDGSDGNGYYGTGYWISVLRAAGEDV